MKDKKWYFLVICLIVLTSLNTYGQTKKLREVGTFKFIPIKAETSPQEVMKAMLEKYAGDIERGFALAGSPDLVLPFMDQVRQSAYSEGELAVGETMEWMIFRSQGRIKVVQDLEWAGTEPLPIYAFAVSKETMRYEIIIPKSCGNIALRRAVPVPGGEEPPRQSPPQEKPEDLHQITKAKIFQDFADLVNEVDLYCSFFIWENDLPGITVIGAEREFEKEMLSDHDVIYLNQGADDGIEVGQIFRVFEIEQDLPGYGLIARGRGRARVQCTLADTAVAEVEHSCSDVRRGHYLVPFKEIEGVIGKDLGYNFCPVEDEGVKGRVVYLQTDLRQLGSNHWALIDLGAEDGLQVGQQLILYQRQRAGLPIQILGNSVVVDVQSRTSTIKVLSCRDVIRKGALIMERPAQ
ncbi:MAG: hypothetical protein JW747_00700 [Candidatus Aminicenantes bacterium]|nr:hypothetical protein [Candidatus Aminicenantes bacterium]